MLFLGGIHKFFAMFNVIATLGGGGSHIMTIFSSVLGKTRPFLLLSYCIWERNIHGQMQGFLNVDRRYLELFLPTGMSKLPVMLKRGATFKHHDDVTSGKNSL